MNSFNLDYIKMNAKKKGIKIGDVNNIDVLKFSHQEHFNNDEITLEEFLSIAKENKVRTIFCEEAYFDTEKYFLSIYAAHVYLKEKYNLTVKNEKLICNRIIENINLRNQRLYLFTGKEIVEVKLTFMVDDTRYEMVIRERWYKVLLQTHRTLEEIIDGFLENSNIDKIS